MMVQSPSHHDVVLLQCAIAVPARLSYQQQLEMPAHMVETAVATATATVTQSETETESGSESDENEEVVALVL